MISLGTLLAAGRSPVECASLLSSRAQARKRYQENGTGTSHAEQQNTGRLYVECVLAELELGDYDSWVKRSTHAGEVALQRAVGDVFRHVLTKAQKGERWRIPEARCQNADEKANGRIIRDRHPKEMGFALRQAVNSVRQASDFPKDMSTNTVPIGWFGNLAGGVYKTAESQLKKLTSDRESATGSEADQRREHKLYDDEQCELFESILSCAVAEQQRRDEPLRKPRERMDTLTLGMIVSMQWEIGRAHV